MQALPQKTTGVVIPLDRLDGIEGVRLLSTEIDRWMRKNPRLHTIKELSKKSGLGKQTVSRIWYKETVAPRLYTCVALFKALGFNAVRFD